MRFLKNRAAKKVCLVISDLHLGAGYFIDGKINNLEDFYYDQELVQFFQFYSTGEYKNQEVEVIINGDFIDFLAVPYVNYFDDKFWGSDASVDKLKIVLKAHHEVFEAMKEFVCTSGKKITYILGNHDAELQMKAVRDYMIQYFDSNSNFSIIGFEQSEYRPHEGVVIKHGHTYDIPNDISLDQNFFKSSDGEEFFHPPWGSYYVSRVINRFKVERKHVASVRPIKRFLINGLIYDFYFTCRFLLANIVYYIMVRFIFLYRAKESLNAFLELIRMELSFSDGDIEIEEHFQENENDQILITGHTHRPEYRQVGNDKVFINTGTWTNMHNLDFASNKLDSTLTYGIVEIFKSKGESDRLESNLQAWKGVNDKPFVDFV